MINRQAIAAERFATNAIVIGEQGRAWSDAGFAAGELNSGPGAVMGPSGCGRAWMRALAGLDPLDAGQVIFAEP